MINNKHLIEKQIMQLFCDFCYSTFVVFENTQKNNVSNKKIINSKITNYWSDYTFNNKNKK